MRTYCAPLVAHLFLFCYERDFMKSLSPKNQTGIIEAFNSTSIYLDDLLNSIIVGRGYIQSTVISQETLKWLSTVRVVMS